MRDWLDRQCNRNRLFRRLVLLWCMTIITITILRATDPDVLVQMTGAGATVVGSVTGLLSCVIGFYQWSRQKDDEAKTH